MAEYDPIRYLDLLEDYISRETLRTRRNLAILSFSIIVIYWFNVSLSDVSLAGVPIVKGKEGLATAIATTLLVFWGIQFYVRYVADLERGRERKRVASALTEDMQKQFDKLSEETAKREGSGQPYKQTQRIQLKNYLSAYRRQHDRTEKARFLLRLGQYMEWVPTAGLAVVAAVICAVELAHALSR